MYNILTNLATHGIGKPGIIERYVNCEIGFIDDFRIIDVRTLIDGENVPSEYLLNIVRVTSYLELREKVVMSCWCVQKQRYSSRCVSALLQNGFLQSNGISYFEGAHM